MRILLLLLFSPLLASSQALKETDDNTEQLRKINKSQELVIENQEFFLNLMQGKTPKEQEEQNSDPMSELRRNQLKILENQTELFEAHIGFIKNNQNDILQLKQEITRIGRIYVGSIVFVLFCVWFVL